MSLTVRRVAAYLIDVALLAIVLVPIASLAAIAAGVDGLSGFQVWLRSLALVSIPSWTYFVVTEHRWGGGVGKRLLDLVTVETATDLRPSWRAAFVRTAITLVPWEATHLAFFGLAPRLGDVTAPQIVLAAAADVLIVGYVLATFLAAGRRSPADIVAGTSVRRRS